MDFEEYIATADGVALLAKLKRKCQTRGFDYVGDEDLTDELESAIEAVIDRRHFIPTPTVLFESKYNNIVLRLCIASISKYGAEGQTSHSENGVQRFYEKGSEYPPSILNEIVPLGRLSSI